MLSPVAGFPHIDRVTLPIPTPLQHVHCYLVEGKHGFAIIDTGFYTHEIERVWANALAQKGIRFADIEQIVLTHAHPDHYGAAGWLQEQTGAPIYLLEQERDLIDRHAMRKDSWSDALIAYFRPFGLPFTYEEEVRAHEAFMLQLISPAPTQITWLREGDTFELMDVPFEVIWVPGHSPGQMMLYHEPQKVAFVGDHVLMGITPIVGVWSEDDLYALDNYLHALRKVAMLDLRVGLSGHREPIEAWQKRIGDILGHHEWRLKRILDVVQEPLTAWEIMLRVFRVRQPEQLLFALAESIAHLEYLVQQGALQKKVQDGTYLFVKGVSIHELSTAMISF